MKFAIPAVRNSTSALMACVTLLLGLATLVRAQDGQSERADEFDKTSHAIVMVTVDFSEITEFGAGVIFGRQKDRLFIATAYHVVHRGDEHPPIRVKLKGIPDKLLNATLLKYDASADLAILSVEKQGINVCALPLERLGDTSQLQRKDGVSAVGNPNGVAWAMPVVPDKIAQITPKEIVFQSTFISKGHSGGALLNENAEVVGMILTDQPPFGPAMTMDPFSNSRASGDIRYSFALPWRKA